MSDLKPIKLYGHALGPNPPKVQFVLEELNLPYEVELIDKPKDESFVKINPNGRLPAIIDPNTNLTLWESGAIMEYLVETYDKEGKLKGETVNDNWLIKQYLHFQMSGQGPYYGQAVWFHKFHPEPVQSAKDRYEEQVVRVVEVLNNILEGKQYLVGDKLTYADLAFVPWNMVVFSKNFLGPIMEEKFDVRNKYANFVAWHERVNSRPSVRATYKGTPYDLDA